MFDPNVGRLERVGDRDIFVTDKTASGVAVFGPNEELGAGRYVAEFRISGDIHRSAYSDVICGWAEVTTDRGDTVLARSTLYGSRLSGTECVISLPFVIATRAAVERRVVSTGRGCLKIDLQQ